MDIYYAIFSPDDGGWGVRFPDAPSVNTCGETVEESLEMAVDALSAIMVMGRKGREYDAPRGYADIKKEAAPGELIFPVVPSEKAMDEYRPKKRINVMVPVDLLDRVDAYVKTQDCLDRSRFICKAVEQVLE
jgi:predicted RNase H-like HicB family nuclease